MDRPVPRYTPYLFVLGLFVMVIVLGAAAASKWWHAGSLVTAAY